MEQSTRDIFNPNAVTGNILAGNLQVEALSDQNSNHLCGFFSPVDMLQAFRNFKKSGAPSRFLFLSENDWVDIAYPVFDELKSGFLAGKTTLEVIMNHKFYLFDFLRMIRIESDSGKQNSIAWIDLNGRCFFPKNSVDDTCSTSQEKMKINTNPLLCSPLHRPLEQQHESLEVSSDRWPSAKVLRKDHQLYSMVEHFFLHGFKRCYPNTDITSIHGCSQSSITGKSGISSFELHKKSIAEVRGTSHVGYGWYGTSADNVAGIMAHGFTQINGDHLGPCSFGIGIHLAAINSSYLSHPLSVADEVGEKHVIFCRVILGKSEKIEPGSNQNHPSSEAFDSGVDDLVNPKWYVVWRSNMNKHIIPTFIVSYKSSGSTIVPKILPLTYFSFLKLLEELGKFVPASKIQVLKKLYDQHKVGKLSKPVLIRHIRSVVGDEPLTSTLKRLKSG